MKICFTVCEIIFFFHFFVFFSPIRIISWRYVYIFSILYDSKVLFDFILGFLFRSVSVLDVKFIGMFLFHLHLCVRCKVN